MNCTRHSAATATPIRRAEPAAGTPRDWPITPLTSTTGRGKPGAAARVRRADQAGGAKPGAGVRRAGQPEGDGRGQGSGQPEGSGRGQASGAARSRPTTRWRWVPVPGGRPPGHNQGMGLARSVGLFIAAGLAEIGGGYLVWRWLRDGAPVIVGVLGAAILVVYGIIPTLQKSDDFGRIYASYGGVFVIASLLWGWGVDKTRPDRFDVAGSAVVLAGVAIIYFAPRR